MSTSPQVRSSTTVQGSPALAAETLVAVTPGLSVDAGAKQFTLLGWVAFTVGTSGTAVTLRIRRGNGVAGTQVASTGAVTAVAADLRTLSIQGLDTPGDVADQQYSLTMQVTAGAAVSTVSAVQLTAIEVN